MFLSRTVTLPSKFTVMEIWLKVSILLCVFGFVKEFRPSEPFITPYLMGEWKNFTDRDIEVIFSTGTYAYLVELVFVFLVTDLLRYKPVIVLDGISAIVTWTLLIWGKSIQLMQILTALRIKPHKEYKHVPTELISSIHYADTSVILATIWALFLPPVKHSIYFNRLHVDRQDEIAGTENHGAITGDPISESPELSQNPYVEVTESVPHCVETHETSRLQNSQARFTNRWKTAYYYLWKDFTSAYTNPYVVKWSFWWALSTCGFLQVLNYVQLIWNSIINENGNTEIYHGAVEATYTVIGATASLGCGWLRLNWQMLGEATLAVFSIIEGALLILLTMTNNLMVAYTYYILFGIIYHTMITVANAEVAKHLNDDSCGLIFGVNTFIALVLQTVLTVIVVDERGLALETRPQFLVYGGYYVVLGVLFGCMSVFTLCKREIRTQKLWLPKEMA
ncbi:hypothetical protein Cfor_09087 [Coptotermes formosanus]|uniref:Thiamine transporter 2 n=1 Tax=Coptotermes formosanus TaxID=36987 RepID=A0A6L2PCQ0_COPFO|nr:hypothetical protein Cfor_09087 [Coptotermes formosanus]